MSDEVDEALCRMVYRDRLGDRFVDLSRDHVGVLSPKAARDLLGKRAFRACLGKATTVLLAGQRLNSEAFRSLLVGASRLEEALFFNCDFGDLGWGGMADSAASRVVRQVRKLVFARCTTGDGILKHLAVALEGDNSLQELRVEKCGVSGVGLAQFLEAVRSLRSVRSLDLSSNPIGDVGVMALAGDARVLPVLKSLTISRCEMGRRGFGLLTEALRRDPWFTTLEQLWTHDNPVPDAPPDLLDSGDAQDWRDYCAMVDDGKETLNVAKVVVLGEGGSGKTHFVQRLFTTSAKYFNPGELRTHDFNVVVQTNSMPTRFTRESLAVRVYDFGGQPELHSTHRLFLSQDRTLYVLVCDATRTREENRLDYWLRYVRFEVSPDVPVLVIVTKCDLFDLELGKQVPRRLPPLDCEELRATGGFSPQTSIRVCEGLGWAGAENLGRRAKGVAESHERVLRFLQIEFLDSLVAARGFLALYTPSFAKLIRWIESDGLAAMDGSPRAMLSVRTVEEAARQLGLDGHSVEKALTICDSIGTLKYGATTRHRKGDPIASVAFNPDWLRTPIYRIIRAKNESRRRGLLTWEQIETLLPVHAPNPKGATLWERLPFTRADRVAVVDLMVANELIFRVERAQSPPSYFVPDHLEPMPKAPALPLGGHWQRSFDWLPESAFGRLVGVLLQRNPSTAAAVWREECVLELGKGCVLTLRWHAPKLGSGNDGVNPQVHVTAEPQGMNESQIHSAFAALDQELRAVLEEESLASSHWQWIAGAVASTDGMNSAILTGDDVSGIDPGRLDGKLRLLVTGLADLHRETRGSRGVSWQAMSPWFTRSGLTRQRENKGRLIAELEQLGLIEKTATGKRSRFRLTTRGQKLSDRLAGRLPGVR